MDDIDIIVIVTLLPPRRQRAREKRGGGLQSSRAKVQAGMNEVSPKSPARQGATPVSARRRPVQGRSQETVRRILEAGSRLAATIPIDEITTSRIAEAAGLTIGAVYRFFPDRDAVLEAILLGCVERFRDVLVAHIEETNPASREALVDGLIDVYIRFTELEPGLRALAIAGYKTVHSVAEDHAAALELARAMRRHLVMRLGYADTEELWLHIVVSVEAAGHLLEFAFRQHEFARDRVVAEVKAMIARYFFD
jgi:AcrR family transcriptional regulator